MTNNINKPFLYYKLFSLNKNLKLAGQILIIASVFYASLGKSAIMDFEEYNIAPFTSLTNEQYFDDNQFEIEKSTFKQARELALQGKKSFQNGNKKQALNDLSRAWELDPEFAAAGMLIAMIYLENKDYDQVLKVALQLQKVHPVGFSLAGAAYTGKGEHDKAKLEFKKAIEARPEDTSAIFNLAAYAIADSNFDKARTYYNDVLNFDAENLQALLKLSDLDIKTGHPEQAIAALEKAINKHPEALQPRIKLGLLHLNAGDPLKTLAITEPALKKHPDHIAILKLVGVAQLTLGLPHKALPPLKKIALKQPDNLVSHYNLALVYEQLGQFNLALQEIDKALKIDANHASARFMRARVLAHAGQLDDSLALLQSLSASFPESPDIKDFKGRIAIAQNRPSEAVILFQEALTIRETNNLIIQLAIAQIKSGDSEAGYKTFYNWLEKHPKDILTRISLADVLLVQAKLEEAQQQYIEIIRQYPDLAIAHNNLAWLLARKDDLDNALKHAEKANKLEPENPQVMDTLGVINLSMGRAEKAVSLLQNASKKVPNDLNMRFHLAQALAQNGATRDAKGILKELMDQDQKFAEYKRAETLLVELEAK